MHPIVELCAKVCEELGDKREEGYATNCECASAIRALTDAEIAAVMGKAGEAVAVSRDWPHEQTHQHVCEKCGQEYKGWQRSASCYACYVKYYAPCAAPAALPEEPTHESNCDLFAHPEIAYCTCNYNNRLRASFVALKAELAEVTEERDRVVSTHKMLMQREEDRTEKAEMQLTQVAKGYWPTYTNLVEERIANAELRAEENARDAERYRARRMSVYKLRLSIEMPQRTNWKPTTIEEFCLEYDAECDKEARKQDAARNEGGKA